MRLPWDEWHDSLAFPSVVVYYQHEQHTVHLIVYHIIWCPKRRRKVLVGAMAQRLEQIIHEEASEHHWEVLRLAIQPDHIHVFLRATPYTLPTEIARLMKGRSSHLLREEFPHCRSFPRCGLGAHSIRQQTRSSQKPFRNTSKGGARREQETQGTPKYASGSSLSDTRTGSLAYGALPGVHQHG